MSKWNALDTWMVSWCNQSQANLHAHMTPSPKNTVCDGIRESLCPTITSLFIPLLHKQRFVFSKARMSEKQDLTENTVRVTSAYAKAGKVKRNWERRKC